MGRKWGWLAALLLLAIAAASLTRLGFFVNRVAASPGAAAGPGAAVDPQPADPPHRVEQPVLYQGPVEHIFFHPLLIYPQLAFGGSQAKGFDDWFVTVPEFKRMIQSMYDKGYILVDIATLTGQGMLLPPGKKPLVLSIDDLNYYEYMRPNGTAYRLIIDGDGNVKTYTISPEGAPVISDDNEIIPILDKFVQSHPDFSYRGAKGVIALTGYEGILGYRTDNRTAPNYESEKAAALAVVQRLKETGWRFASHGWGHLDAAKVKYDTLVRDTQRWKDEVEPLLGPTSIYIYPFGSQVTVGDAKFQYLQSVGFRIFCGIGPEPFLRVTPGYTLMDRRHVDGVALRTQRRLLLPFFDADQVIDSVRPKRS